MRRAARVDNNHGEIRDGLRKLGFSVFDSSGMGRGFPDLVVADEYRTILVEVKSGGGALGAAQEVFHEEWQGEVITAYDILDVLEAMEHGV